MRVLRCETEGADVPLLAAEETETLAETLTVPIPLTISVAVAVPREAPKITASLGPGVGRSLGEVAVADADAWLEEAAFLSGRFIRI